MYNFSIKITQNRFFECKIVLIIMCFNVVFQAIKIIGCSFFSIWLSIMMGYHSNVK